MQPGQGPTVGQQAKRGRGRPRKEPPPPAPEVTEAPNRPNRKVVDDTGTPRRIVLADVRDAMRLLLHARVRTFVIAEENAAAPTRGRGRKKDKPPETPDNPDGSRPVNTYKTYVKKMQVFTNFVKRWIQKVKGDDAYVATDAEINDLDWRDMFAGGMQSFLDWFQQTYPHPSTRKTYLGYLVTVVDNLKYRTLGITRSGYDLMYAAMTLGARAVQMEREMNAVPRQLQNRPDIDWQMFVDAEEELSQSQFGSWEHLILGLRVLLAPRRDDDFVQLRFRRTMPAYDPTTAKEEEFNYCVVPRDETEPVILDFRAFKTSGHIGRTVVKLSDASSFSDVRPGLAKLGRLLRQNYEADERDYVLGYSETDVPTPGSVADWIKGSVQAITNVAFGVQILRRIYSTWVWEQGFNHTQLEKSARLMGHSVAESNRYRMLRQGEPVQAEGADAEEPVFDEPPQPAVQVPDDAPPATPVADVPDDMEEPEAPPAPRKRRSNNDDNYPAANNGTVRLLVDALTSAVTIMKAALDQLKVTN